MILLVLGVLLFSILHLVPALPRLKAAVVERLGRRVYGPVFGLISIVALGLIVLGWRMAEFIPVYEPPAWGRHANFALTLVAFLCLGVFLFRGQLRQRLRFPMGLAVLFWVTGHLLANGDVRSLILFGGLLIYAGLHIIVGLVRDVRPTPEVRGGHDLLSLLAGVALYGVMTQLHPFVIGVPIFSLTR
jgi:uncharacterized membrane protein